MQVLNHDIWRKPNNLSKTWTVWKRDAKGKETTPIYSSEWVAKPKRQNFVWKKPNRGYKGKTQKRSSGRRISQGNVWWLGSYKHGMTEQNLKMVATLLCWSCWEKWLRFSLFTPTNIMDFEMRRPPTSCEQDHVIMQSTDGQKTLVGNKTGLECPSCIWLVLSNTMGKYYRKN